jgi:hypothetical protein
MAVACLLTASRRRGRHLAPVLAIPAGLRIAQLGSGWPMSVRLGGAEFSGAREARDLSDRIDNFVGATIVQELDRPSRAR